MRDIQILLPQYVESFKCIGGRCEDTCCAGWCVNIDEKTYKKYKRVSDYEMKKKIGKNIIRVRSNISVKRAAKMKMINNQCSFLTDEKLCEIQQKLGSEYLCDICSMYPRMGNMINGIYEQYLTLSCPEAARLILINSNLMTFDVVKQSNSSIEKMHIKYNIYTDKMIGWRKYIWEIRAVVIEILQVRKLTIEDRLLIIGLLCNKLDQYKDEEKKVLEVIEEYRYNINNDMYTGVFDNVPKLLEMQVKLCNEIIALRVNGAVITERYNECLEEMIEGLKLRENLEWEGWTKVYDEAYQAYYKPYMNEHEYMMENYLVNYIFGKVFPILKECILDNYVEFIIHYVIMKMHLIGVGAKHQGLSEELVIRVFQSVSKTFEHNKQYFRDLMGLIVENKYNELAYMTILIKN